MRIVSHFVVGSLKAVGGKPGQTSMESVINHGKNLGLRVYSKVNFSLNLFFAVLSHCKKEGLSLNQRDVKDAAEEVMKFLFLAKADNRGEFKEISKAKDKKAISSSVPPSYYSEMTSYFENNCSESVVIVSISNTSLSEVYKCDLIVTSRDMNGSDFSLQLANCLNLPSSSIVIECSIKETILWHRHSLKQLFPC